MAQVTIRPDQLRSPNLDNPTIARWFDPTAFAPPVPGFFGTSAKGVIKGPGRNNLDVSLLKYFRLSETASLRVGAWVLNFANHPQYNDPATNISSVAAVGVITSVPSYWVGQTPTPRMAELNIRLNWAVLARISCFRGFEACEDSPERATRFPDVGSRQRSQIRLNQLASTLTSSIISVPTPRLKFCANVL